MRARHGVHGPLGVALRPGRLADGVAGLLHQQGFVAMHRVKAAQAFLQVRGQLRSRDLHQIALTNARRRMTCWVTSPCMSSNVAYSTAFLASTAVSEKEMSRSSRISSSSSSTRPAALSSRKRKR